MLLALPRLLFLKCSGWHDHLCKLQFETKGPQTSYWVHGVGFSVTLMGIPSNIEWKLGG